MLKSSKEHAIKLLLQNTPLKINWWTSVSSTNAIAKQQLTMMGYNGPTLYGSDEQTSGYGKQNRHFISQKGGIYLSLVIKVPALTWQNQGLLTTGVAWQLHQAIKQELQLETQLKWVNDLLFKGKKIAGILVEKPQADIAIIGIGCNLYQAQLTQKLATATNLLTKAPSEKLICQLIATLMQNLLNFIPQFDRIDFLPDYKKNLTLLNKDVTLTIGKQKIYGHAVDLTPQANLVLETKNGRQIFNAGEITQVR